MRTYKSKTTGRLCHDPDDQNEVRAEWALVAIEAFQAATGTDDCDAISDLLCDIRHLCDQSRRFGSWEDALNRVTVEGSHYDAETSKEG